MHLLVERLMMRKVELPLYKAVVKKKENHPKALLSWGLPKLLSLVFMTRSTATALHLQKSILKLDALLITSWRAASR